MKKICSLLAAMALLTVTYAAYTPAAEAPEKTLNAREVMIPIGGTDQSISLQALSTISAAELEKLTGREMGFADKMAFKSAQRKLKRSIEEDGTISSKKLKKHATLIDGETGFHLGGFALGFLIGLIGVLIAYLINDGKKPNRTKWAWIGLAAWVVIILISLA